MVRFLKGVSPRNGLVHLSDASSFFIGVSLCSFGVIIPSYAKHYSGNSFLLALIPLIVDLGMSLPQLLSVYIFKYKRRTGNTHINTTRDYFFLEFIHRFSFIAIAVSIFIFAGSPREALLSFFIFFIISNFSWGFVVPNWIDILTITIPDKSRTSFMAFRETFGRIIGIIASLSVPFILASDSFPRNYGWLFLTGGIFFTIGILPAAFFKPIRKIPVPSHRYASFTFFVKDSFRNLFKDKKLTPFLIIFWTLGVSRLTYAYYTPYIIDTSLKGLSPDSINYHIGILNFFFLVFLAVTPLVIGKIIRRIGYKRSLIMGACSLILANLIILLFHNFIIAVIGALFISIYIITSYLASLNALMDHADPDHRGALLAANNTINVFFILLFSLAGSKIADLFGYGASLTAVIAATVLALIYTFFEKRMRTK
jgi:MFS family permease